MLYIIILRFILRKLITLRKNILEYINKRQRIPKGQSTVNNLEKLATQGTQEEEKQSKKTTQYVWDTTLPKQTQIA